MYRCCSMDSRGARGIENGIQIAGARYNLDNGVTPRAISVSDYFEDLISPEPISRMPSR
jgi:hypothetical protein